MPIVRPSYPNPPMDLPWGFDLVRQLSQRDVQISNALAPQTGFCATSDAATTFTGATPTDVTFTTTIINSGGRYDGTNIYYAPLKGLYTFTATLTFDNTATVNVDWLLTLKTTPHDYGLVFTTPSTALPFSASLTVPAVLLEEGDTVQVQLSCPSGGGTVTLAGDATQTLFSGYLVEVA